MSETVEDRLGRIDYESPWFHAGFVVGQQYRGDIQPIVLPVRTPEMTDVDWASYNEAILMSSCEDPKTVETPRESEDLL